MKIVVAIMAYPGGVAGRTYSYDYYNIYLPLDDMSEQTWLFDFHAQTRALGKEGMNREFLALVTREKPDIVVVVPTEEEFESATIAAAGKVCPVLAYFHDDVWRGEYALRWARFYTAIISTDSRGEEKFRACGLTNAIYSPRGYNPYIYTPDPADQPADQGVSFVGGYAPYRAWLIQRLRAAGIPMQVYGSGWATPDTASQLSAKARRWLRGTGLIVPLPPNGYISQSKMVEVFRRSTISLNLSNGVCWDARYLTSSPLAVADTLRSRKDHEQIKGRHFEINACGGFQLSYYVEGLEKCFNIGREIAIFVDPDDLIEKARYYMAHETERHAISQAGLRRTQQEHSIVQRFSQVFARIGLMPK